MGTQGLCQGGFPACFCTQSEGIQAAIDCPLWERSYRQIRVAWGPSPLGLDPVASQLLQVELNGQPFGDLGTGILDESQLYTISQTSTTHPTPCIFLPVDNQECSAVIGRI